MSIDYGKEYSDMLDGELVELAAESDDLVEDARAALWSELRRRGLEGQARQAYAGRANEVPAEPPPRLRLATVATFSNLLNAQLARSKLLSEGIDCFLADEHIVRMDWFLSFSVGRIKLRVREEDAATARDVLTAAGTDRSLWREYEVDTRRRGFRVISLRLLVWLILLETGILWLLVTVSMLR